MKSFPPRTPATTVKTITPAKKRIIKDAFFLQLGSEKTSLAALNPKQV
jgi:hypothetical protein